MSKNLKPSAANSSKDFNSSKGFKQSQVAPVVTAKPTTSSKFVGKEPTSRGNSVDMSATGVSLAAGTAKLLIPPPENSVVLKGDIKAHNNPFPQEK